MFTTVSLSDYDATIRRSRVKLLTFTIIAELVSAICGEYQGEMKLISQLTEYFKFDHHIFVFNPSSVDVDHFINASDSVPRSLFTLEGVAISRDKNSTDFEIGSKNAFMIVIPVIAQFDGNFSNLRGLRQIQRLQPKMKIGMFLSKVTPIEDLHKLFEWCKRESIVNIFVATSNHHGTALNVFAFHPFGTLEVKNVTKYRNESIIPSLDYNFHEHHLRSPPEYDNDVDVKVWNVVLSRMNASSFEIVPSDDLSTGYSEDFDVLRKSFVQSQPTDANVYALTRLSYVLLVPEALPYSGFTAYLIAISSDTFFGYFFILLVGIILLLIVIRYINHEKCIFFESVADVLNLLMNDNGAIKYSRLAYSEMYLIVPLTFVGLVVVNGILSILQSYITRPIALSQIKTAEDIYESNLPVLVWEDSWKNEVVSVLENHTKFKYWDDRVVVVPYEEIKVGSCQFNRSISFLTYTDIKDVLLNVQRRLNLKGYYDTQIQIANFLFAYRVGDSFIFFDRLNEILLRIQSAGLYDIWERQKYAWAIQFLSRDNLKRIEAIGKTEEDELPFPIFIVYGWLCSVIVFGLEIIVNKFKSKRSI